MEKTDRIMKNIDVENRLIDFIHTHSDGLGLYWVPLVKLKKSVPVVSFNLDAIYRNNDVIALEKVFRECGISNVNTFQMNNREYFQNMSIVDLLYEKDDDGYNFPWNVETFYFDSSEEWLVYVSHEGTISFTGRRITETATKSIDNAYNTNPRLLE